MNIARRCGDPHEINRFQRMGKGYARRPMRACVHRLWLRDCCAHVRWDGKHMTAVIAKSLFTPVALGDANLPSSPTLRLQNTFFTIQFRFLGNS